MPAVHARLLLAAAPGALPPAREPAPGARAAAPALRDRRRPCASEVAVGTVGLEPTISSARGWQSTMLTYVPGLRPVRRVIILEPRMRRVPRRCGGPACIAAGADLSGRTACGGPAAARGRSGHTCMARRRQWHAAHPVPGRRVPRVPKGRGAAAAPRARRRRLLPRPPRARRPLRPWPHAGRNYRARRAGRAAASPDIA